MLVSPWSLPQVKTRENNNKWDLLGNIHGIYEQWIIYWGYNFFHLILNTPQRPWFSSDSGILGPI